MQSMKNALAVIGIVAIAAVAGFIGIHSFDKDGSSEISDAASYDDIQDELQKYADILNTKGRLYVNQDIYRSSNSNSFTHILTPVRGTVQVNGLSLQFDLPEPWTPANGTHYLVPYHAICGISYADDS